MFVRALITLVGTGIGCILGLVGGFSLGISVITVVSVLTAIAGYHINGFALMGLAFWPGLIGLVGGAVYGTVLARKFARRRFGQREW